jgi:hypothetical protein
VIVLVVVAAIIYGRYPKSPQPPKGPTGDNPTPPGPTSPPPPPPQQEDKKDEKTEEHAGGNPPSTAGQTQEPVPTYGIQKTDPTLKTELSPEEGVVGLVEFKKVISHIDNIGYSMRGLQDKYLDDNIIPMERLLDEGNITSEELDLLSNRLTNVLKDSEKLLQEIENCELSNIREELSSINVNLKKSKNIINRVGKCSVNELKVILNTFNVDIPMVNNIMRQHGRKD